MRGRKPRSVTLAPGDLAQLQRIARQPAPPFFQVQRARIVLALAAGEAVHSIAPRWECDPATVWRLGRRYEHDGLAGLLTHSDRSGRPERISPPAAGPDHPTGLLGAGGSGAAHHALVQRRLGTPSRGRRHHRRHQPAQYPPHLARGRSATPSHPLLEDRPAERPVQARHGYWVAWTDELPNFQVLERVPIRRAIPGSIEQREFEYKRHGTVTVLVFLIVHTGQMEAMCFESKSAIHYTEALRHFRRRHRHLRGVYLIHDGDSTHTGDCTPGYLSDFQHWWHPRLLPPDASWLNQAEPLLDAFELHYLKRGSWCTKEEFRQHIEAAWPEYNRLYAHPFDWEWTIPKMKQWFAKHSQ